MVVGDVLQRISDTADHILLAYYRHCSPRYCYASVYCDLGELLLPKPKETLTL
ncbi:Uncharacterised protein [Vibrio cholerae]|nr:Uncharacterised protein [Vibrio cholerae]